MSFDSPPAQPAPASVRPRRQLAATALLLAAAAGLAFLLYLLRAHRGDLDALAAAACRGDAAAAAQLRRYLVAVLAVVPASVVGFAGYVVVLARRVRRAEAFPPPGTWTVGRVRFSYSGRAARVAALAMLAFAGVLLVLTALLVALGLRMLAML